MNFCFGSPSEKTLHQLHLQELHPVSLYAVGVRDNQKATDGYNCGPYAVLLHDLSHCGWANLLSKKERSLALNSFYPRFEKLQQLAREHQDQTSIAKFDYMAQRATAFDLTPISAYQREANRNRKFAKRNKLGCLG